MESSFTSKAAIVEENASSDGSTANEKKEGEEEEIKLPLYMRLLNILLCNSDDEKLESAPVPFKDLFRYAQRRDVMLIVMGMICAIAEGFCLPVLNFLSGKCVSIYIDTPDPIGNTDFLRRVYSYTLLFLIFGIIIFIVASTEYLCLTWASERIVARIRREFVASVLAQDSVFLDSTSPGGLSSQLNNNVDRIRDGLGDKIGLLCRSISLFVSATVIAFVVDWRITLLMVGTGPMCAITFGLMPRFAAKPTKTLLEVAEEANGIAEEAITNVKTVAACNGQQTMIERYSSTLRRGIGASIKIGFIMGFFEGLFYFILYIFYVAGLWYGIVGYHNGWVKEAGNAFIVVNEIMYSSYILGNLGPHMMAVLKARAAAGLVYKTIDRKPLIDARPDVGKDPATANFSITFKKVHFSYPTRPQPILRGLSWRVLEGETVALVGKSGCGKSTSIGLITRLFNVDSGSIDVGGSPIEEYNVAKLRKSIGLVSQEPPLFNGSVRDNIRLGREEITDEDVERAARIANAHEFIHRLDKGYSTLLGPSGVSLSGGQKQRIAIARAVVGNPRILLLDEATSALDTHSERVVQAALNKASAGRTTVIVAHRLSTIKHVNRVYVIDEGTVIEEGTYAELSQREGGGFAAMVKAQVIEERKRRQSEGDKGEEETVEWDRHEKKRSESNPRPVLTVAAASPSNFLRTSSMMSSIRSNNKVHPIQAEVEYPCRTGGIRELLAHDKKKVALEIIVACAKGSELFILAIGWNLIFQCLYEPDYYTMMVWTMIGELLLGLFVWACIVASRMTGAWVSESVLLSLRTSCLSSLLHRPISYFDRPETAPAACSVLLSQQAPLASPPLDYRVSVVYENAFAAVLLIALCFFYCWPNAIICILLASLFIVTFYFLQSSANKSNNEMQQADVSGELAMEVFQHARSIQLLSVESFFKSRFETIQKSCEGPLWKRTRNRGIVHAISQTFCFFSDFIATSLGAYLVFIGMVDVMQLYTSEVCVASMGWAVMLMAASFNDLISSSSAARLLFSLINPNAVDIKSGSKPELKGAVSVREVTFAYPSRPAQKVASNLNFHIQPGSSLALVGPSGGGKSTIVNLLERFYDPDKGTITLDGSTLLSLSLHHLRSSVGLVGQEPVLFRGSIMENITLGVEGVSIEEVRAACKLANAADFIESFPGGYSTPVGERGRSLSGGQKQRIAIARALIRKPKVILLDEATSALDSQSEQVVKEALERTAEGRTSISVAHRLDTIKNSQEILFVEDGRIMERGNHEHLMSLEGKYAALVKEQRLT